MNNLICMKSKQMQNLILILIKFYQRFGYIYIYMYVYYLGLFILDSQFFTLN